MKKGKEQKQQNKIVRIITTPFRVLAKAKDMYVRSITKCGNNMNYSSPVDAARFEALPRSYSAATSRSGGGGGDSEDFAELMRAASARTLVNRIDVDLVLKQQQQKEVTGRVVSSNGLPKSVSVGMGRIDEEMAIEFSEREVGAVKSNAYPRSRSYAVGKTGLVM